MTKCPTCGKVLSSELGMKQHHSKVHGESLAISTRPCSFCDSEVRRHDSHSEDRENVFCDDECYKKWRSENKSGENHPRYGKNHSEETKKQISESLNGREANKSAVQKRAESLQGRNRSEETKKKISASLTGEQHPRYVGGGEKRNKIPMRESLAERILERDDYECQECGLTNEEHLKKQGHRLHIHHKKPRREFVDEYDDIEKAREAANDDENLVSLCNYCHVE